MKKDKKLNFSGENWRGANPTGYGHLLLEVDGGPVGYNQDEWTVLNIDAIDEQSRGDTSLGQIDDADAGLATVIAHEVGLHGMMGWGDRNLDPPGSHYVDDPSPKPLRPGWFSPKLCKELMEKLDLTTNCK